MLYKIGHWDIDDDVIKGIPGRQVLKLQKFQFGSQKEGERDLMFFGQCRAV